MENLNRESGLKRELKTGQLTMMAMGCAIGTGLFLGSGLAIGTAGPGVLISYGVGAIIVLLLMGCLAEMTVAHPTSGAFGTIAEKYISPWAGFIVRYSYWMSNVLAVGVEVSAIAVYMNYWFPNVPGIVWILFFAIVLIYVNSTNVHTFATFEYWFSMIKVSAIVLFILLGAYILVGGPEESKAGFENFANSGQFMPFGWWGIWVAVFISLFSFLGTEQIAVTAGEAKEPDVAVPKALKATVFRLSSFYVLTMAIMLLIVPWQTAGVDKSPFVKVMEILNIPGASGIMNFIILTAALSAMNSQLYASTRLMYSLSLEKQAPAVLGKVSKKGIPTWALIISTLGIFVAAGVNAVLPESSYAFMMGISMFGSIFTWLMIFVSHLFFRKQWEKNGGRKLPVKMIGFPYLTILGGVLLLSLIVTTWFTPFKMMLQFGIPWLIFLVIAYWIWKKKNVNRHGRTETAAKKFVHKG
ncbi:amino acid permease [Brevibacillus centrosporus]|uniref:amino acid permease n=1 Tax=Brevibacillus centrosporus TaxID=54910 RepID=UPI000F09F6C4|nr:amino acid permease [Brevibacillus centrosporus]MEC2129711.1 amino acid permease [Brevibacillus centrosporus]RNB67220.1 amino acid permease [Brevibacillus centrosporus]GED32936.1 amino acid permease [Brevibacillus centrosporus]